MFVHGFDQDRRVLALCETDLMSLCVCVNIIRVFNIGKPLLNQALAS